MPTYRIRCGDMDTKIKTPHRAHAVALALLAVDKAPPKRPTALIEVSGGQFKGDDTMYVAFAMVARKLGRVAEQG